MGKETNERLRREERTRERPRPSHGQGLTRGRKKPETEVWTRKPDGKLEYRGRI